MKGGEGWVLAKKDSQLRSSFEVNEETGRREGEMDGDGDGKGTGLDLYRRLSRRNRNP